MDMKMHLFLAVVFVVALEFSTATDFCHVKSCGNRPHTVCSYPRNGPSLQRCTGHQGSGLSNDEKAKIVDLHNKLRQRVARGRESRGSPGPQPAAKSMPNLKWDDELATVAQRWADQCSFGHDQCRDVDRFGVGQNVAMGSINANANGNQVESLIQLWYDEVKYFSRHAVTRFNMKGAGGQAIGHYTQMVWGKTTTIGCGAIKYRSKGFNQFYLVCNYGPAGNYLGQPVYETR